MKRKHLLLMSVISFFLLVVSLIAGGKAYLAPIYYNVNYKNKDVVFRFHENGKVEIYLNSIDQEVTSFYTVSQQGEYAYIDIITDYSFINISYYLDTNKYLVHKDYKDTLDKRYGRTQYQAAYNPIIIYFSTTAICAIAFVVFLKLGLKKKNSNHKRR